MKRLADAGRCPLWPGVLIICEVVIVSAWGHLSGETGPAVRRVLLGDPGNRDEVVDEAAAGRPGFAQSLESQSLLARFQGGGQLGDRGGDTGAGGGAGGAGQAGDGVDSVACLPCWPSCARASLEAGLEILSI